MTDASFRTRPTRPPTRCIRSRALGPLLIALVAAVLLGACSNRQASVNRRPQTGGSATASAGSDGVQQVTITVNDTYRFSPDTITVHPGRVQITLVHKGNGAPHDWQLSGIPADYVPLVNPGHTSVATFTAPTPGRYQFVCTIHRAQGQTGTLIVLSS